MNLLCRRIQYLLGVALACQIVGYGQQPPKPAAPTAQSPGFLGVVGNGRYTNQFFGVDLQFPATWTVIDDETTSAVMEIGTDVLKGTNERSNRALEAATKREVVLFHISRKPVGSLDNCSFMIAVLKQPHARVLPSMVAEATKSIFATSPDLKIAKDTRIGKVGGVNVAMVDYEFTAPDRKVQILYNVAIIKGYSFSFSSTFSNDEDRAVLEQIISSMRFNVS